MKTDDLVSALARSAAPVDARRVSRQFTGTLFCAALLSMAAMLLMLGMRADWRSGMQDAVFWLKLLFPAVTAIAAFVVLRRLAYPGARVGVIALMGIGLPFAVIWLLGALVLVQAPAVDRHALVFGSSWWKCAAGVAMLAVPATALTFLAMRKMAPTRLALTGAAAGLFGGSAGAFAYALYCTEMQIPFIASWYAAGILAFTALGAFLGRRVLRW